MPAQLTVSDDALDMLRPLFSQVEGSCEVWTDSEIVTRLLIRGVMAYGQTAGRDFADMSALAGTLRETITAG
ncbi:hypothetical protein DVS28_a1206 [Euzebya pacifica]|uniref:Uncharacterized protein n=1 Tax=Euzebya pacifica TaxID=1608957 RepID=A0A346XUK9_9ACTN|nr:hypothetical protein [Euzebya pacifica]AXV05906.1 hypothetical protein DVS28_a1206 [Euzebya pacifica]